MRRGTIQGLVLAAADPLRINGIWGSVMHVRTDGNPATTAALDALDTAGLLLYRNDRDKISDIPPALLAKLSKHHFTQPGTMWEPAYDEEGLEIPQRVRENDFFAVVRDAAIFHSRWLTGTRRTVVWAHGELVEWGAALGELVIAHEHVEVTDEMMPRIRAALNLDVDE